jgi:hypothetical protein
VYAEVNCPQVSERGAVIGALELQVSIEGGLVGELVDEELDFIEDANVVLLVLDLEVAVSAGAVYHVNHVHLIDELGELGSGGCASPRTVMKRAALHNTVLRGRVGCGDVWEGAGRGGRRRSSRVKDALPPTHINAAGGVTTDSGGQTIGRDCVGTASLEGARKIFCARCH